MTINATSLRKDIYNILDTVIETGVPVDVTRHGKHLKIVVVEKPSKLKNLKPMKGLIKGDPADLESIDWSHEWQA